MPAHYSLRCLSCNPRGVLIRSFAAGANLPHQRKCKGKLLSAIVVIGTTMVVHGGAATYPPPPDTRSIVARSVAANDEDWAAAPGYDFTERDRDAGGTKTFQVMMILGSPYYRPVASNGRSLTALKSAEEQQRLESTTARRQAESPQETARRIAQYRKDREGDHLLMSQLTDAFDFVFLRQQKLGPHRVYVLKATPRPDYRPPNLETEVLTGMEGTLWIDTKTFQWVKVEAHVVHPVSIAGFLARVEPGTFFQLEEAPVGGEIWLPSHFVMRSRAKILFAFRHNTQADETYFDYRLAAPSHQTRQD